MPTRRPLVLLTGFGPFPGMPDNASARLAETLAESARGHFPAYQFLAVSLPTEWIDGPRRLRGLYRELRPQAALHFGVSARATGFEIELRGRNRIAAVADAAGVVPADRAIDPDGPPALPARLPVTRIFAALRAHGLPVSLSRDAGGYLCNALLYHASDFGRRHDPTLKAGFFHVPASLAPYRRQPKRPPARSLLDWEDAIRGGLVIIGSTLGSPLGPLTANGAWRSST